MELTILLTLAVVVAMIALIVFVGRTPSQRRRPMPPVSEPNRSYRPDVEQYRDYRAKP